MTPQEISSNAKYQQALERADKAGIVILARATDKQGAFLGCLVQGKNGDQYHVTNENNALHCDCIAGQKGSYCYHRAIVTRAEMERAAAEKAAQVPCKYCGSVAGGKCCGMSLANGAGPYSACYVCGGEAGIYRDCCKKVVCMPCFAAAHSYDVHRAAAEKAAQVKCTDCGSDCDSLTDHFIQCLGCLQWDLCVDCWHHHQASHRWEQKRYDDDDRDELADSEAYLTELATQHLDDLHDYATPSMMLQEPILVRNDSGPRLYRTAPVLAERVKEAW